MSSTSKTSFVCFCINWFYYYRCFNSICECIVGCRTIWGTNKKAPSRAVRIFRSFSLQFHIHTRFEDESIKIVGSQLRHKPYSYLRRQTIDSGFTSIITVVLEKITTQSYCSLSIQAPLLFRFASRFTLMTESAISAFDCASQQKCKHKPTYRWTAPRRHVSSMQMCSRASVRNCPQWDRHASSRDLLADSNPNNVFPSNRNVHSSNPRDNRRPAERQSSAKMGNR